MIAISVRPNFWSSISNDIDPSICRRKSKRLSPIQANRSIIASCRTQKLKREGFRYNRTACRSSRADEMLAPRELSAVRQLAIMDLVCLDW